MANDRFYTQKYCDRCGRSLKAGRTMSMYNTDCICMECKNRETMRDDYSVAEYYEAKACSRGDYDFSGIGYDENF